MQEEEGYEEEDDYMSAAMVKMGYDEEGELEEDESSTLLSLSEKPDRNMALLDDYESEELDFATDVTGHRSGKFSFQLWSYYVQFLVEENGYGIVIFDICFLVNESGKITKTLD